MSDGVKSEISSDIDQNYSLNTADPKNVQELTIYVSISTFDFPDKGHPNHLCTGSIHFNQMILFKNRYKLCCKMFRTNFNRCRIK